MLVNEFLQNSAERFPDKVALVCGKRRLTYAQIEEQTNRVANGLQALGMERGERLAIWLPNSVETVVAIFAILKAGGVFTVINPTTKPAKLAYILNNCTASGLFAPTREREAVVHLFETVPSLRFAVLCGQRGGESATLPPNTVAFPHLLQTSPPA
ncbi:MAG TPA: AMP-dependent synthetase, partial [Anaerolineales bacterium]|nr:AMP-dependent synthetase [Anaerolineae bacterium]HIQ02078.1 AMP-dependent synthetase [Anaerolineales bacterium]